MLHDFLSEVFDARFRPSMPSAGFADEQPDAAFEPDGLDLAEAVAHQDAAGLRVALLSDEALDDLIARCLAERDSRPALPSPVAGRIMPGPHYTPAA